MVNVAADLAQFVQRRELLAYEQRVARAAYAYGVDLRRAAWLDHSTIGEPLMRSVDRKWTALAQELSDEVLLPPDHAPPSDLLEEVSQLLRLLRAPLPTIRLLRPSAPRDQWPILTPLGTTRGGCHWLLVDLPRLTALSSTDRTFLLGSALGNLQCDHGPMLAAHLMAYRGRRFSMVRSLLKPWSRVSVFSADRAGLLAVGDLATALDALEEHGERETPWLPTFPELSVRKRALQDFDRSRVMTRLRLLFPHHSQWTIAPSATEAETSQDSPDEPEDASKPREDTSSTQPAPDPGNDGERAAPPDRPDAPNTPPGPRLVEDVVEEAEREADKIAAEREEADQKNDAETTEQAKAEQIKKAWPLARVDARLTRRLGIL